MWIEYQIVEQQSIQSDTVRVDSNGNGLFGGNSGFSPVIFRNNDGNSTWVNRCTNLSNTG